MRKLLIIIFVVVLIAAGWIFRYDLVFQFQYSRLKALKCQEESGDFINDTCLNKIWAHRVNSVRRYRELEGRFAGVETDITWDRRNNNFLVYHPPLQGTPVSIDSFLSGVDLQKGMIWLDTREVAHDDSTAVLSVLKRLDQVHGIRMNAILEIYDTVIANLLAERGYWVALNINNDWIRKFSRESQWEQLRRSISPEVSFVSQEDRHVPLLKKQFPGRDIITWSISFSNYYDREQLRKLVKDEQVKIILVNIKSNGYQ